MRRLAAIILFGIYAAALAQEVQFTARASRTDIGEDDRVRVDFVLNRQPDQFTPPAFKDFRVVMGPMESSSSQFTYINGKMSRTENFTYSYVLMPLRSGSLRIGPATATVDGKTYRTQPIMINVLKTPGYQQANMPGSKPGNRNEPAVKSGGKDVFLRLELTAGKAYVGQAIGAVYKLYVKDGVGVSDYGQVNISEPKGFWTEVISDKPVRLDDKVIDGTTYHVFAMRRLMLIPQHPGRLRITPQKLDIIILRRVLREWGLMQFYDEEPQKIRLTTGRATVEALPLPEKDKPVDFSGAVGNFDFSVTVEPQQTSTGRDLTVRVQVLGKGNLNMFDLPKPSFPPQWEVYDPEHKVHTTPTLTGYRGSVADVYTIIPRQPGKYTVPPVSFSYFDPYEGTYKRISSPSFKVEVSGAPMASGAAPANPAGQNDVWADIARKADWHRAGEKSFTESRWFGRWMWGGWMVAALLLVIYYFLKNRKTDPDKLREKKQSRYIRQLLSDARKSMDDREAFYGKLEKAILTYFRNRLQLPVALLNRKTITEKLVERHIPQDHIDRLTALWDRIDMARYAPSDLSGRQSDLKELTDWLEKTDKILKK